ncbi:CoA transferase [Cupriavidus basilensis]|uniref:CoA transferase n=1 Tax=Cupriavidus basilensis TaxID=68895 RepID=A0ABT6ALS5_9BURK|nr:CoA transferase [Cupriavidus basilensis]MDF3833570.1 CoA transferase [Cupriavidus basilensis]
MPNSEDTLLVAKPAANDPSTAAGFAREIWRSVNGHPGSLERLAFTGSGNLPSVFPVTDLATAAVGAAGLAMADLIHAASGQAPLVEADRRLASLWFGISLRPQGWELPAQWDAVAGDYQAADGWIRLHTNAPHHREAALRVLGVPADKAAVARAVSGWQAGALEAAIVENGGCAAAMRSVAAWATHPQGMAVNSEPLLHWTTCDAAPRPDWAIVRERPLRGIRVLDLTRILAGPVATRFLAGFGAHVLRIDPPGWEEPGTVPDVVLGKRCARLDLKSAADRQALERLLGQADVLVHGYRPEALARLGLDPRRRREINPGLVDVSLDAYGWSGPWKGRRGFDSLVQMSTGIAEAGMRIRGLDRPGPLPVQAIDHATGYLMATAVVRGLAQRLATGAGCEVRASLARTAHLLAGAGSAREELPPLAANAPADLADAIEATAWGPARRVRAPAVVQGAPMHWERPAGRLGTSPAQW